jgi:hypothetical protein
MAAAVPRPHPAPAAWTAREPESTAMPVAAANPAAVFAAVLAGPPSDASLAGRWVFCPTTYPMANATANSSTTIKKPLSSCLLPTTSSNSPVSLFLMS